MVITWVTITALAMAKLSAHHHEDAVVICPAHHPWSAMVPLSVHHPWRVMVDPYHHRTAMASLPRHHCCPVMVQHSHHRFCLRASPPNGGTSGSAPGGGVLARLGPTVLRLLTCFELGQSAYSSQPTRPFFLYVKLQKHAPHKLDVSSPQQYLDPRLQQGTAPCLLNPPSTCVRLPLSSPAWRDGVGHLCASSPTSPFVRSFVR